MQIAVLGPLEVRTGDGVIDVAGARLRTLLIRLALAVPAPATVTTLVDAVWPDDPPADPANALQSLVSRLRRALNDADAVRQVPGGYRLAIGADDVDVRRFARLAREGRAKLQAGRLREASITLRDALALWRSDAFDAAIERDFALFARLHEEHLDVLADRIEADLRQGHADEAITELDQLTVANPLRERLTLQRIQALAAVGRVPEALAAYEQARRTLSDELGIDPSSTLQQAHLALLRGEPLVLIQSADEPIAGATNSDVESDGSSRRARSNLRAQLTSFVGREDDVRRIAKLLDESRLVTLVGPGGAGKTRLASEAAERLIDTQADGIWLAELAPVSDSADVAQVVLAAFGLRDSTLIDRQGTLGARDATTRLVDVLGERECVLVLDNCEHLIEAAAALADELLAQCPRLKIVTTSREPLGVYGEVLVVVAPLGQPAADVAAEVAMSFPATQLFADRAAAARPSFVVDETTVAAVVEIVRRLDGLPLAIELAAARLRTMPVENIAARLTDRFRLLTGGSRTAMPRHRTLLAVVEWSWELLSEDERRLARRLAVFVGGITAASAADICASAELPEDAVEDLLSSLVDKSLLQLIPDQGRYRMLETLREFGLERMADVGEVSAVRRAHARHFAALAKHADPQLRTRDQLIWLDVLNAERDNIVAALRFLVDDGDAEAAVEVAVAMNWYWLLMGRHGDAATWTAFALAAPGPIPPTLRAVGNALATINSAASLWTGEADEVSDKLAEMARANEQLDQMPDTDQIHPLVRVLRPVIAMMSGDNELSRRYLEEAMATGDPWAVATARTFRAGLADNEGDIEQVRADAQTSLAEFRELGERWGLANCLQLLAPLNVLAGDLELAAANFREALELFNILGASEDEVIIRLRLADVLIRLGDAGASRREIEAAMRSRDETREHAESLFGSERETLFAGVMLADLERQSGQLDAARQLRDDALERLARMPAPHPIQGHVSSMALAIGAKIDIATDELATAGERLREAYRIGVGTTDMPIVATVGIGVAMYANALARPEDAAEILGAAARLRGADDITSPDVISLREQLSARLGDEAFTRGYDAGRSLDRDGAIARLDPAPLQP